MLRTAAKRLIADDDWERKVSRNSDDMMQHRQKEKQTDDTSVCQTHDRAGKLLAKKEPGRKKLLVRFASAELHTTKDVSSLVLWLE